MRPEDVQVDRRIESAYLARAIAVIDEKIGKPWGPAEWARDVVIERADGGEYTRDAVIRHYLEEGWSVSGLSTTTFGDQADGKFSLMLMFGRPRPAAGKPTP